MKKLSRRFDVDECDMYKFRGRIYTEQPSWTEVKYYLYNEDDGSYTAVLKRDSIIFLIMLLFAVTAFMFIMMCTTESEQHIVRISDTIYTYGETVGLNAMNAEENRDAIELKLFDQNGEALTDTVTLKPAESVGYVDLLKDIPDGSYMCNLRYTVKYKFINVKKDFSVLLVVQDSEQEGVE